MVGVKGMDGKAAAVARQAIRRARRDAFTAAAQAARQTERETTDDEPIVIVDDDIPRPSAELSDYPDGEAERQLAWGRYQAAEARRLEVETKRRTRIPLADVRAWCVRVQAVIGRRLPQVQTWPETMPGLTDEQRDWLRRQVREWDRAYREELAREIIE